MFDTCFSGPCTCGEKLFLFSIHRWSGGDMHGVPAQIDTDRERAWTTPEWRAEMQRRGIQHRFKTDRYTPNSLGMIDEKVKRVKVF